MPMGTRHGPFLGMFNFLLPKVIFAAQVTLDGASFPQSPSLFRAGQAFY